MPKSWLHLSSQSPDYQLSADLTHEDAFHARDCGWVEQMRPFIREFSQPGDTVLDPFAGFASTLVAAGLERRRAIGIEIEDSRIRLARQRLAALGITQVELLQGDCREVAASLPPVDLILSSLPYFGCGLESQHERQLYASGSYGEYLQALRAVFKQLKSCLKPGGYIVVMIENIRLGAHFVPQAFDVARLLAERFEFVEERIIVYDKHDVDGKPDVDDKQEVSGPVRLSNRAHEYALIARQAPRPIDTQQALALVRALQARYPDLLVIGSFARYLVDDQTQPADVDLFLPGDAEQLRHLLDDLEAQQFQLTRWGMPMAAELATLAAADAHYVRAERLLADGRWLVVDVCFSEQEALGVALKARAVRLQGVCCLPEQLDLDSEALK
jgi:SAM-dependent methyltransferase